MSETPNLDRYLTSRDRIGKRVDIITALGETGTTWVDTNLTDTDALAKVATAKKMVNFLLDGRKTPSDDWTPVLGEPVGLVRSTGKFEPVIFIQQNGNNISFNTLAEYRAKTKKSKYNHQFPWYKAKFFFFNLLLPEIPNDMVNLSDESEDDNDVASEDLGSSDSVEGGT